MAMKNLRPLIEDTLLGSGDSRRLLQYSPILADVWETYADEPCAPADLLITSHKDTTALKLAAAIYKGVKALRGASEEDPGVAPLLGFVAAKLYFEEVLKVLVPMTTWWHEDETQKELKVYLNSEDPNDTDGSEKLDKTVNDVLTLLKNLSTESNAGIDKDRRSAFERFVALCALVFYFASSNTPQEAQVANVDVAPEKQEDIQAATDQAGTKMLEATHADIRTLVFELLKAMQSDADPMVRRIALNRPAAAAIEKSVPMVKGDAARRVFGVDCSEINWAIIDSGIDAKHTAFKPTHVVKTYDFTHYREIVNLGNVDDAVRAETLKAIKTARGGDLPKNANANLKRIAKNLTDELLLRWDLVTDFVLLENPPPPVSRHGTHVAGIMGACKQVEGDQNKVDGMCPGIGLYDFRILSPDPEKGEVNTEFAVIATLQFIRYTNAQAGFQQINGVNMSLSLKHNVRNYACGSTPVCIESERLIDSGVVVVAAAGNFGYQQTIVDGRPFENYLALSITDPGNAERVITVGSTHRVSPFTYGISYFSSRGPTGDGRMKPDLVAPGERIHSTQPNDLWGFLDGTSMAAPHVSGAAAMLMARYPELIGKPDRIKRILCDTATDLGRERNFQGHGLLDVLRALQSQ
jgi:serine protease AprX